MKKNIVSVLSILLMFSLSACANSVPQESRYMVFNSSQESKSSPASEAPTLTHSPKIDETSWDYISANHDFVTYDDVKSGKYNEQYIVLSTTIDSVEYSKSSNWVTCYAWFSHDDSFICEDIIFQCDKLPNYSPKALQAGDNIDVCFYINRDSSFGSNIKAFSQNDNSISLEDIYTSFKDNCAPLNWEEIMRNPEKVRGTTYTFTGNVFQIISEKNGHIELLLSTDNEDQYVYVSYKHKENEPKFLENDTLTIYGTFYVPYKYKSVLGSSHSVPAIVGQFIEIQY